MKRKLFYLMFILLVLSVLFFTTKLGVTVMFTLVKPKIPGTITFSKIDGNLMDNIILHDITYQKNNIHFTAKQFVFSIDIPKILKNKFSIPYFQIIDGAIVFKSLPTHPLAIHTVSGSIQFQTLLNFELNIYQLDGLWLNKPLLAQMSLKNNPKTPIVPQLSLSLGKFNFKTTSSNLDKIDWTLIYHKTEDIQATITGFTKPNKFFTEWDGKIVDAHFSLPVTGFWNLIEPTAFHISSQEITIQDLKFSHDENIVATLFAHWTREEGFVASVDIPPFPVQNPNVEGKVGLTLHCFVKPKQPLIADGDLTFYPGFYMLLNPENKQRRLNYLGGNIHFEIDEKNVKADYIFKENNHNELNGDLFFALNSIEKELKGNLIGKFNDLNALYIFFPQISRLKSNLDIHGTFSGTLKKPILTIHANSKDGSFYIPKQAVFVNHLNIDIDGEFPQNLQLTGSGQSGDGKFNFNGSFNLQKKPEFNLKISGKNIQIYNTKNIQITASPTITLHYLEKNLLIEGNVPLVNANIMLQNDKNTMILSKDIIILNPDNSIPHPMIKIIPRLYLTTENRLHFKGYGLDGIVSGKINIEKRADGLLAGTGRLTIKEGKYRLQGATRYIQRGYLLFPAGTLLTDPILDIYILQKNTAEMQNNGDVGIYVQGTLQKPILSPYSNSNLQNSEILSRLGFGGTQNSTGEPERQAISQTAFLLAGTANPFVEHLQENFGLEEFNIESRETHKSFTTQGATDTVLVLGKALSRKVYLQYLQSVLEPISTIRLKYLLTPHITVSAETGSEGLGGDLIFSLERD